MLSFDKFYNADKDRIDIDLLALILKREHKIRIGHNKLYRLAKQIKFDHPKRFQTQDMVNKNNAEKA